MVSLVVTIIVLLILSTISIQALTGSGLFKQTKQAKLQAKRSQVVEWLGLKLMEEQGTTNTKTEKQIIESTKENVEKNKGQLEELGKVDGIEEVKTEEDGEEVPPYFYVTVDNDVYKVEGKGTSFVGEKGEFPPVIKITKITNTTDSITVTVKTLRNDGGKVQYYLKGDKYTDYKLIKESNEEGNENTYTFSGLKQGVNYSVKIVAIATNKKTAEVTGEQITGKVIDLKEGDIKFEPVPSTWTNKNVKVTAKPNIDIGKYTLRTSIDGKNWTTTNTQTFSENGMMYAILWDGTNYGAAASQTIGNIDKVKPVLTDVTSTTNSITIKATDEASGIVGYAITTTNVEPTDFENIVNTKNLERTIQNQKQGTTYYVWVKDEAGNVSESKSTATGNVTNLTKADLDFTYTPSATWTNQDVTVTVKPNIDIGSYKIRTSKDGKTWETTNTQTFSSNGQMYVILWDGTNYGVSAATAVGSIDKSKPIISSATATSNAITIKATDEASGIVGYAITESTTQPTQFTAVASTKDFNNTFTGYKQGTTYYTWVKDAAGNVSASKSTATKNVTDLTKADITITSSPSTWTNTKVTATAKVNINTGSYTIRTSKDGKNWTTTNTQEFTENGTMYVILWDGTNYGGSASQAIGNIDTAKPTISTALKSTAQTVNSITLSVGATDTLSGLGKIEWYYGSTNNPTTQGTTIKITDLNGSKTGPTTAQTKQMVFTGLIPGKTYYFKAKIYDVAGNSVETQVVSATTVKATAADVSYTPSESGWKVENVKQALDYLYNR